MLRTLQAFAVLVVVAASACSGGSDTATEGRPVIVTTVAPITSIVSSVVGDRATVTGIVPEGSDSHTFEPKPSAAEVLSKADVVYMNGLQLEEPTKKLAQANLADGAEVVELGTQAIPESEYLYDFSFPRSGGKPNPHLWTDPPLAKRYAEIVKDDVSKRDPKNADYYDTNYQRFAAQVDELDAAMRTSFKPIPNRRLLTYNNTYAHFAKTYDWKVVGAIQVSDFEDPTPKEVASLVGQVKREKVPAIFGSEVFPSPVLKQIGREADVRYVDVLRDDDLPGEPGEPEHSWMGLMRFDFITMTEALDGDATALKAVAVGDGVEDKADYPQ